MVITLGNVHFLHTFIYHKIISITFSGSQSLLPKPSGRARGAIRTGTKQELYAAELQVRKKRKGEDWADFAEHLKVLVDKAYLDFEDRARERLALNHYMHQLDNAQVTFGV